MELRQANPRRQGDLGEYAAIEWLAGQGYDIYVPLGHSPDVDLIAGRDGRLLRVQVKTSTRLTPCGNYQVMICTRGGNQSWSGVVKRLDPGAIDYLFVLVSDGRRWFIPVGEISARTAVNVGTAQYAPFEVDPWPVITRPPPPSAHDGTDGRGPIPIATLPDSKPRRDTQAVNEVGL